MLGSRGIFKRPRDFFPDCDVGAKQDLRRPGGRATTFRCNFKYENIYLNLTVVKMKKKIFFYNSKNVDLVSAVKYVSKVK